ncbi:MAG: ferritin-like domain-containing protein [Chthonomonadales bacterium]|nr:ferritin-like domain-containing protein [Chthonomonadales bacterium]
MPDPHAAETRAIPPANRPTERQAAAARRAAYPYRFPPDRRALGGKFTVEENARRLLRFFYLERRLSQGLGSWTLSIPDFEVKVETGRHIFQHMDAARRLRERLHEQEMRLAPIDAFRDEGIDLFLDEMLSAADAPELLVGAHLVAGRALATAYRHHIDDTCPVSDAPTVRVLRQILVDYEPMLEWAQAAVAAYVEGGIEEDRLEGWRWHLSRLLAHIGDITGADEPAPRPRALRIDAVPYRRGEVPLRDSRFATFHNTGDYNLADGEPRYPVGTYEDGRLRFVRTQRDEVDAIEAFGTFLWDIRFKDFDAEYYLARITWDEARHTETGHRALQTLGYDPYELPNRLTSSTCRGPMEPAYAMAEINLFGEIGVLKTINSLIDEARARDDSVLAHISDFIRADERTHVRNGQHIIKVMTDLGMQELEQRTRELFTECLVSLGAVKPDGDIFTLTREDIEKYIGE